MSDEKMICNPWNEGPAISIEFKGTVRVDPAGFEFFCVDTGHNPNITGTEYLELPEKERKNWFPLLEEIKLKSVDMKGIEVGNTYKNPAGEWVIAGKDGW